VAELKGRRELFAAAVAEGLSYTEAARRSGYGADSGNASRRARDPEVAQRIEELKALRPPDEPEPEAASVASANGTDRVVEFQRLRDEALRKGHSGAAVAAQNWLSKYERDTIKREGNARLSDRELVAKMMPTFRRLRPPVTEEQAYQICGKPAGMPIPQWLAMVDKPGRANGKLQRF
jgi:hypothetical protein